MSNLIRERSEHLYNSLSVADFGIYSSARTGNEVFCVKKSGFLMQTYPTGAAPSVLPAHLICTRIEGNEGNVAISMVQILDFEAYPNGMANVLPTQDLLNLELRSKPSRKGRTNEYIPTSVFLAYKMAHVETRTIAHKIAGVNDFVAQNASRKDNKHPEAFDGNGKFVNLRTGLAFATAGAFDVKVSDKDGLVSIAGAALAAFKTDIVAKGYTWIEQDGYIVLLGKADKALSLQATNVTAVVAAYVHITAIHERTPFELEFDRLYLKETVVDQGVFSTFDSTDVARIFSIKADQAGTQPDNIAIKGAKYILYRISYGSAHYGLDSASVNNQANQVIDLYVKEDLIDVDIWDASDFNDEESSTKDANFEELLTAAFGIDPFDWATRGR